jgi:hypothetical protein
MALQPSTQPTPNQLPTLTLILSFPTRNLNPTLNLTLSSQWALSKRRGHRRPCTLPQPQPGAAVLRCKKWIIYPALHDCMSNKFWDYFIWTCWSLSRGNSRRSRVQTAGTHTHTLSTSMLIRIYGISST